MAYSANSVNTFHRFNFVGKLRVTRVSGLKICDSSQLQQLFLWPKYFVAVSTGNLISAI